MPCYCGDGPGHEDGEPVSAAHSCEPWGVIDPQTREPCRCDPDSHTLCDPCEARFRAEDMAA